jgi:hypothetical protein
MSIPVQDDLEDVLEECSRLRRLGYFADAIAMFRDRLGDCLDNRYVLVQYAQCLYDAGQYSQLEKLAAEKAPHRLSPPDVLQLNWDMLLFAVGMEPVGSAFERPRDLLHTVKTVVTSAWPSLDSTEVSSSPTDKHGGSECSD